jgi:hypothetical protein
MHLLNNAKAIRIVAVEDIGTHESKYGHDVMKYGFRGKSSKLRHQQKSLVEGGGIFRD